MIQSLDAVSHCNRIMDVECLGKEKNRIQYELLNENIGNTCSGSDFEQKTEVGKIEKQGAGPQPSNPRPFSRLLRRAGIIR